LISLDFVTRNQFICKT